MKKTPSSGCTMLELMVLRSCGLVYFHQLLDRDLAGTFTNPCCREEPSSFNDKACYKMLQVDTTYLDFANKNQVKSAALRKKEISLLPLAPTALKFVVNIRRLGLLQAESAFPCESKLQVGMLGKDTKRP